MYQCAPLFRVWRVFCSFSAAQCCQHRRCTQSATRHACGSDLPQYRKLVHVPRESFFFTSACVFLSRLTDAATLTPSNLQIKVQLFGSVPIRTYLPHGDIDCTFCIPSSPLQDVPNWANRLMKHIKQHIPSSSATGGISHPRHHPAPNAHFRGALSTASAAAAAANASAMSPAFAVHSVNVIPAEVTLVKCNIDVPSHTHSASMVVDISFNQRGGVNAANFLEEADRYIDAYQAVRNGEPPLLPFTSLQHTARRSNMRFFLDLMVLGCHVDCCFW